MKQTLIVSKRRVEESLGILMVMVYVRMCARQKIYVIRHNPPPKEMRVSIGLGLKSMSVTTCTYTYNYYYTNTLSLKKVAEYSLYMRTLHVFYMYVGEVL